MKNLIVLLTITAVFTLTAVAQNSTKKTARKLDQNTVVTDSSGMQYPYLIWSKLVSSGDFRVKTIHPSADSNAYLLVRLTAGEKDKRFSKLAKPAESSFFTIGQKLSFFNASDINGKKIKLKEMAGKVIVLNFWFIGCPPCRREIPELNKLALEYANDPDVIFVAVALDNRSAIRDFIKSNPFSYYIIDDGQEYANLYKINLFPTNVVVDKDGKVRFHNMGYAVNTAYWIKKTIKEAKGGSL